MILDNSIFTTRSFIPSISGPSFICSFGNSFTVNNLPPGTTITWDQNSNLTRVSPQSSNPCTFAAAGQGSGWIEASITTGCGTIDLPRKEVNADPGITGEYAQGTTWKTLYTVNFINREETTVVCVESEGSSSPFDWQLLPEGSVVNWGSYNTSNSIIGFNIISGSQASFSVSTTNVCGSTVNGYYYFVVSGGYSLSLSPNPGSGETTLTIESTPEGGEDEEWTMEVYTSTQLLKEKKTRLKGKEYKLNTSGWKKGIYIVNVKYGDEILTARLVVEE